MYIKVEFYKVQWYSLTRKWQVCNINFTRALHKNVEKFIRISWRQL